MGNADTNAVTLPTARATGCPFDPPPGLAPLRAERPLARMSFPDGHLGWLVTDHATARTILSDLRFSARAELQHSPIATGNDYVPPAAPGQLMAMDPPDHTRYRQLLARQFTTARMSGLEEPIRRIVAERLDAMEQAGPGADLVPTFASPIGILVVGQLLGVPEQDRKLFWQDPSNADLTGADAAMAAFGKTANYLQELVRDNRKSPGDGLIGSLIKNEQLTDEELVNISMMLFVGGTETTSNMISLGVFALLEHPRQLATVRNDSNLLGPAVDELLRYLTIAQIGIPNRVALEDAQINGHLIKKGETVSIALPSVNHDPKKFTDPSELRVDRTDTGGHLAFGHGIHRCLGAQLAKIELRISYTALFDRFPTLRLAVPPGEIRMRERDYIYGPSSLPVAWD